MVRSMTHDLPLLVLGLVAIRSNLTTGERAEDWRLWLIRHAT